MKTRFKPLLLGLLFVLMLTIVGCSKTNSSTGTDNTNSTEKKTFTNEEYYTYLNDRYTNYFKGSNINSDYDIYADKFTYNGTYDEFITGYNEFHTGTKANLEAFKKDLETGVVKGNAEVDKLNQEVITSVDKAIKSADEYTGTFAEKTKDYGTMAKNEVIGGLRTLGKVPHEARMELDKMINNAKSTLGIK